MKQAAPFGEQVTISSSDSDTDDVKPKGKQLSNDTTLDQHFDELSSEDAMIRRAKMYQEYMELVPIPTMGAAHIPFTSWTDLAATIKKLYGQPLHYLTNFQLKQWNQMRFDTNDEDVPLEDIIHPRKAEATIWLIEECHRRTSSFHYIAKLWLADPNYHAYVDPIFPKLQNSSK